MFFKRINPNPVLEDFVREFWVIEDDKKHPVKKKIIPDGYPEIIIHYGDSYRIRLQHNWEIQSKILFAGQITRHFYLQNTGISGMIGVKLLPTAPYRILGKPMNDYSDRVVPLKEIFSNDFEVIFEEIHPDMAPEEKIYPVERHLLDLVKGSQLNEAGMEQEAINLIFVNNGLIKMEDLSEELKISRRHLERMFKKVVGLTPKFYSRIIRFNYIFETMKTGSDSWIDIALEAGYFDQSHFIKEFKEFTGDEPSKYGFEEQNMANFFLKKE